MRESHKIKQWQSDFYHNVGTVMKSYFITCGCGSHSSCCATLGCLALVASRMVSATLCSRSWSGTDSLEGSYRFAGPPSGSPTMPASLGRSSDARSRCLACSPVPPSVFPLSGTTKLLRRRWRKLTVLGGHTEDGSTSSLPSSMRLSGLPQRGLESSSRVGGSSVPFTPTW